MTIGEFIQRKQRVNPDGGLGTLTPEEEACWSDLLNGPHKLCECQSPGCGCPIIPPRGKP